MGRRATVWLLGGSRRLLLAAALSAVSLMAQPALQPRWRRVGNTLVEYGLSSPASGPVERVWFDASGARLFVRTADGRGFETSDFETWKPSAAVPPEAVDYARAASLPEPQAHVRANGSPASALLYAVGRAVYRSQNEGRDWQNVSHFKGQSILGEGFTDLAVSPGDSEDIVVSTQVGVWRSLDGGLTWTGLNDGLPNLPARKLLAVPGPGRAARIELDGGVEAQWSAGRAASAWAALAAPATRADVQARAMVSAAVGAPVLAAASSGEFAYAGGERGRLWASADQLRTWRSYTVPDSGAVEALFVSPEEPRLALAALRAANAEGRGPRLMRTFNGGLFWDDLTANLPPGDVHSVTADVTSGAVYAAASDGVYVMYLDLRNSGGAGVWQKLAGLPAAAAWDVKLDEGGNQLFAVLAGHGVFATLAPHRFRAPRVVNAADFSTRAAAPGTLLSVLGSDIAVARTGSLEAPILAASGGESQIQVPFDVTGRQLSLALTASAASGGARRDVQLPLLAASPAIFIDRDGMPMILDADRGVLLEPGTAARAGSRIQVIATGLGRVTPDWPTGTPAPAENTPRVVAPVRAFVDRVPVEVTRATLAPGFVGFYLVEITLPEAVNNGPAELYIEAAGQSSGRVTVQLVQ